MCKKEGVTKMNCKNCGEEIRWRNKGIKMWMHHSTGMSYCYFVAEPEEVLRK